VSPAPVPLVPAGRPRLSHGEAEHVVRAKAVTDPVCLLGVRGYYRDTMGKPGENDRGLYDDALFVLSPTVFAAFNANTDPSVERPGIATLEPGVWRYQRGMHGINRGNPYPALVQAAAVIVRRDGGKLDSGWFGINIHKGSRTTTSSEGCQTLWPDQWQGFFELVKGEMIRHAQIVVPYVLVTIDALS
jgi:lysozyme